MSGASTPARYEHSSTSTPEPPYNFMLNSTSDIMTSQRVIRSVSGKSDDRYGRKYFWLSFSTNTRSMIMKGTLF